MADDNKKLTSLLGRSSGTSWGELAGAYMSGSGKKDNRARNMLIASLLFNAKEASMQSKVMKNLEDMKGRETTAIAKAKAEYQNQFKLQEKNDAIINKGVENYYDVEAETAFNKYVQSQGIASRYDGSNDDAIKIKREWKNNYANEQYKNFQNVYAPDTKRLSTFEEYSTPLTELYKTEERSIASPTNLSIVHNVLDKVGIGSKANKKLITDYTTASKEYNERKSNDYSKPVARIQPSNLPLPDYKTIKIGLAEFDEELANFGIDSDTPIFKNLRRQFNSLPKNRQTLGEIDTLVSSGITNEFLDGQKLIIKEETEKHNLLIAEGMYKNTSADGRTKILAKNIRTRLGVTDLITDAEDAGYFFAELSIRANDKQFINDKDGLKRQAYIKQEAKKYMDSQVAKGLGLKTKEQVKQAAFIVLSTDLAAEVAVLSTSTLAAIGDTPLNEASQDLMEKDNPELYQFINSLDGKTFNDKLTNTSNETLIENKGVASVIFDYQKDAHLQQRHRILNITLDNIFDESEPPELPAGYEEFGKLETPPDNLY